MFYSEWTVMFSRAIGGEGCIQCESKKSPLKTCGNFSKTVGNLSTKFHMPAFLPTLDYELLFNYLQLWRNYAILSVTTQFKSCAQNVHHRRKRTLAFSDIFPKQFGIFSPNFTRLLDIHKYARIQIFTQSSPTVTKLCHFKCDHSACVSVDGGHFEHIMVVALNMA